MSAAASSSDVDTSPEPTDDERMWIFYRYLFDAHVGFAFLPTKDQQDLWHNHSKAVTFIRTLINEQIDSLTPDNTVKADKKVAPKLSFRPVKLLHYFATLFYGFANTTPDDKRKSMQKAREMMRTKNWSQERALSVVYKDILKAYSEDKFKIPAGDFVVDRKKFKAAQIILRENPSSKTKSLNSRLQHATTEAETNDDLTNLYQVAVYIQFNAFKEDDENTKKVNSLTNQIKILFPLTDIEKRANTLLLLDEDEQRTYEFKTPFQSLLDHAKRLWPEEEALNWNQMPASV